MDKVQQTGAWSVYTVPDAQQRAAETMTAFGLAPSNEWEARLDQIEGSPLGGSAYGAVSLFGGSQRAQNLALGLGTAADGLLISAAGLSGRAPQYVGAQTSLDAFNDGVIRINSNAIRFTQDSISFAKRGYTLDDIAVGFDKDPYSPRLVVDVVQMPDGALSSVDNSRPAVLNVNGGGMMDVRLRGFNDPISGSDAFRFRSSTTDGGFSTPSSWGEAATWRIQSQGEPFSSMFPNGSPYIPKVTGAPPDTVWTKYRLYSWER